MTWSGGGNIHYPTVVSFHTGGFYERDAFELVRSCQLFHVPYHVEAVKDLGTWTKNTKYKPQHLLNVESQFPGAILWLDADARVRSAPHLLWNLTSRVAYCKLDGRRANSGTVYLHPEGRRDFLLRWHEKSSTVGDSDQESLGMIAPDAGTLPSEYCWIYDFKDGKKDVPDPDARPVIEHMQASRWTK